MKYLYQRNNGIITKYAQFETDNFYIDTETLLKVDIDEVLLLGKVSENIIDLIEVGDYVNGMLVTEIAKNEKAINICFYNGLYAENLKLVEFDIKSIVTKEQFEKVKFEV